MSLSLIRRFAFVLTFGVFLGLIVPIGAAATVPEESPDGGSSQAANLQLAHHLIDRVFNEGDAEAAAQLVSDDVVLTTSFGTYTGTAGLIDYVAFVHRTYTDAAFDIVSVRANGGSVIVEWRMTASEIVVDPTEQPLDATVDLTETMTLLIENHEIADIALDGRVMTITEPSDVQVAYEPVRGQPY